jgi:NADPH:quinone reductase-like Zn-dependent oxidoreductase
MKAIQFDAYGEPAEVLAVADRPVPEPGKGEVRVRILASPINPSDLLYVRGHYSGVEPHYPAPVGFEGVGIVDALGPEADGVAVGQRVAAVNGQGGNWAEYAVLPAGSALPAPDGIADEQVASFMINPASAILMVRHVLAVPPGEWLLQSAAGSELGRMIIRLAKRDGIRTLNVVRRRDSVAELKALGADEVIVSTEGPIDEQVHDIVGREGVKYAIDPVVGQTGTEMFKALHQEGKMLIYGSLTREPIRVGEDPRDILSGRRTLEVFWLGYWLPRLDESGFYPQGTPAGFQLVKEIEDLMRSSVLVTSPGRTYSLDEIGIAVAQAESVGRHGKVLLNPGQTAPVTRHQFRLAPRPAREVNGGAVTTAGVRPQAWTEAFASKSAELFGAALADDVVLEASILRRPVEGLDEVMRVLATASGIYESLRFTHEASNGQRTYLEWDHTALGGLELRGVTVLSKDDSGQIVHAAIHHRPLEAALRFSAELGKRLTGLVEPGYFYEADGHA